MPTTALDDLNSLLTDAEKTQFAELMKNPKLKDKIEKGVQFFLDYAEDNTPTPTLTSTPTPTPTPTPAPAPEPAKVTPSTSASADLTSISALLDSKLDALRKEFVPAADVSKFRTEILSNAIKLSDDYAAVREAHREEFGERLDRAAFETFVEAAKGRYPSMLDAHNAFVNEKRIELRVKKGVEEGIKQKNSGATVPAQTTSTALSPAQEVFRKAKASENANGETNVSRAAARLAAIERSRNADTA